MKHLPNLLILALGITILSSCNSLTKNNEEPSEIKTKLARYISNADLEKNINVKFYGSEEDYLNDVNVLQTVIIPANQGTVDITLKNKTKYYYDLYSDDLLSTNWADGSEVNHSFTTDTRTYSQYPVYNSTGSCHRHVLLYPNKTESRWVAVGSFTVMGSTWNSITESERNKSIIFRRNLSATYQDGNKIKNLYFGTRAPAVAFNAFEIKLYDVASYAEVDNKYGKPYLNCRGPVSPEFSKLKPGSSNYNITVPITDTIYITNDSFKHKTLEHTFILVREK